MWISPPLQQIVRYSKQSASGPKCRDSTGYEFLELTRIESGQLELYPTPSELRALLEAVADRMAAQAQQRGSAINLELPAHLPIVIIDAARIEQVLLNLLQNALTFTPRGGQITIGAAVQTDRVALWIRDTGTGIPPDDVPHIFERFYKADRARSGGGTGLGLAIAKHLVERHGGCITAESAEGAPQRACDSRISDRSHPGRGPRAAPQTTDAAR